MPPVAINSMPASPAMIIVAATVVALVGHLVAVPGGWAMELLRNPGAGDHADREAQFHQHAGGQVAAVAALADAAA